MFQKLFFDINFLGPTIFESFSYDMHNNGQKAWEFVSVFPENERGTYGRRIAESKWQSQTQSPPRPQKPTSSPYAKITRPNSSPNHQTSKRRSYQPPSSARHTYGGPINSSTLQQQNQQQNQRSMNSPQTNFNAHYSQPIVSPHGTRSPSYSPGSPMCTSPLPSSSPNPNRNSVNSPMQIYIRPQTHNSYEQMKVDDGNGEDNPSTYFQVTPARSYYNSSMSSSVIGSKSSNTNLSRACPLSSSDPQVQNFLVEEDARRTKSTSY